MLSVECCLFRSLLFCWRVSFVFFECILPRIGNQKATWLIRLTGVYVHSRDCASVPTVLLVVVVESEDFSFLFSLATSSMSHSVGLLNLSLSVCTCGYGLCLETEEGSGIPLCGLRSRAELRSSTRDECRSVRNRQRERKREEEIVSSFCLWRSRGSERSIFFSAALCISFCFLSRCPRRMPEKWSSARRSSSIRRAKRKKRGRERAFILQESASEAG